MSEHNTGVSLKKEPDSHVSLKKESSASGVSLKKEPEHHVSLAKPSAAPTTYEPAPRPAPTTYEPAPRPAPTTTYQPAPRPAPAPRYEQRVSQEGKTKGVAFIVWFLISCFMLGFNVMMVFEEFDGFIEGFIGTLPAQFAMLLLAIGFFMKQKPKASKVVRLIGTSIFLIYYFIMFIHSMRTFGVNLENTMRYLDDIEGWSFWESFQGLNGNILSVCMMMMVVANLLCDVVKNPKAGKIITKIFYIIGMIYMALMMFSGLMGIILAGEEDLFMNGVFLGLYWLGQLIAFKKINDGIADYTKPFMCRV